MNAAANQVKKRQTDRIGQIFELHGGSGLRDTTNPRGVGHRATLGQGQKELQLPKAWSHRV